MDRQCPPKTSALGYCALRFAIVQWIVFRICYGMGSYGKNTCSWGGNVSLFSQPLSLLIKREIM